MRALVQRVTEASVSVDGQVVGAIGSGICVLVGVTHDDTAEIARKVAAKLRGLRIFDDDNAVMNVSLEDSGGSALVISQFTLYGSMERGRRPSWVAAAPGQLAEPLVEAVAGELESCGIAVQRGVFGADMLVSLVNDGPVTVMIEM
ncbi:MAG: D-aminoacyl-tRNA deacylase [Microthrixaceae bacterium]